MQKRLEDVVIRRAAEQGDFEDGEIDFEQVKDHSTSQAHEHESV